MTKAQEWVTRTTHESARQVASRARISHPTLTRQIREDSLTPENVINIARAYKASPVTALVEMGFITDTEVMEAGAAAKLTDVSDADLVDLLERRILDGGRHPKLHEPMSIPE